MKIQSREIDIVLRLVGIKVRYVEVINYIAEAFAYKFKLFYLYKVIII